MTKHHRRSIRLKDYDYARAGYYFVTICTQNREHLFAEIIDGEMILNDAGKMVKRLWYEIPHDFSNINLHEFIIMPNHIHGIIEIIDIHKRNNNICPVGVPLVGTQYADSQNGLEKDNDVNFHHEGDRHVLQKGNHKGLPLRVGDIVGVFKSKTTNEYINMVKKGLLSSFHKRIWQRNYYEHIIRDDAGYERVATYILNNPLTWDDDILSKS